MPSVLRAPPCPAEANSAPLACARGYPEPLCGKQAPSPSEV